MADRDDDIVRLVRGEHTDAVQRLEESTARAALGDLDAGFTATARDTTTAWTRLFGSPHAAAGGEQRLARLTASVRAALARLMSGLGVRSRTALDAALAPATELGAEQGAEVLSRLSGDDTAAVDVQPSDSLHDTVRHLPDVVDEQHRGALYLLKDRLLRRLGLTGALAAIGRARGVVPRIEATVSHTVNAAVNEGIAEQIRHAGARKLWISERDACTACLAYAGLVVDTDADFPGGLDWDPRRRGRTDPVPAPPRHPACRCRLAPWDDDWAVPGVPTLPESLQREARRSVARGYSLPSESNAARIRAASELLRTGARLPKSVAEFAQEAVRAGRFTDRTFPATGPGKSP